jgi:hypothetical protein
LKKGRYHSTTASALLPLHVNDLLELEVGGVGGEQTSSYECVSQIDIMTCHGHILTFGVSWGQADLRVDVTAARRHNSGGAVSLVVLKVVASHWAIEGVLRAGLICVSTATCAKKDRTHLRSLAGEVVGRLQSASDALFDVCVAAVVSTEDRVLEASRIFKLKGELAVLPLLSDSDTRTNGGNVGVVYQGYDTTVIRDNGADGTLRAPSTAGANLRDFHLQLSARWVKVDLSWVRSVTTVEWRKSWCGSDERSESKKPLHDDNDDVVGRTDDLGRTEWECSSLAGWRLIIWSSGTS